MARQRSGPYLPGVRSRLWRFIPAAPEASTAPADPDLPASSTSGAEPVMALISRLPLPFDDEA
jgi:hypothetical protein